MEPHHREKDGVAVGGVELGKVGEFGVVGPDGAAMGDEKRWVPLSGGVIEGFVEVAGDLGPCYFEVDVLRRGKALVGRRERR